MGQKVEIDCSTNDEDAKVSLLHKSHPLFVFNKRQLKENKLLKRGQAFTLVNLDLSDVGIYTCEAKDKASRMIRWPSGTGYLILFRGKVIFKLNIIRCNDNSAMPEHRPSYLSHLKSPI